MKILFILTSLYIFISVAHSQRLTQDFQCEGTSKTGIKFETGINDISFAEEVIVQTSLQSCTYKIISSSYSERSVAPSMLLDLVATSSCKESSKLKFLKEGFLRIDLKREKKEVYAHVFIGHDPAPCKLKSLNVNKLKAYIEK